MPEERTLPIPAQHREFTVKVDGEAVSREQQLLAVTILKSVNKLSSARLVYLDGAPSSSDFPLSNADTFIPGKEVEILAGAVNNPVSLFKGIIIKQSVKIRESSAPSLIIECRHQAVKLSLNRKSAYFFDKKDEEVMNDLLSAASLDADVESTSVTHKALVQYNSTDWDFIVSRAEANGKLVLTNSEKVEIKAPAVSSEAVCTLLFGSTILDFDAEMDARYQHQAVKGKAWDSSAQELIEVDASDPGMSEQGNFSSTDLAEALSVGDDILVHAGLTDAEAQAWVDAYQVKSKFSKIRGRARCEGISDVEPAMVVKLSGVGDRYNGDVMVAGVRHDFDTANGWKTNVQFGLDPDWFLSTNSASQTPASAVLPAVSGLQIGVVLSNEDPDGEHRVRVKMPTVNNDDEGTWARVAVLDAGDKRGFFFRPEIDDEVILGFLNDDPRHAVILGMLHSSAKPAPLDGKDDNHEKVYQSRSEMKWYLNDEKKIMTFETPAGNKISLDEDETKIHIEDQNGNKLIMNSDGILIESAKALELKAGTEIKVSAGTSLDAEASTQLSLKGSAGAELSSSANTTVKGSMVMIN